jgi:hypothetical protein
MFKDIENKVIILILFVLLVIYLYLLLSPSQPKPLSHLPNIVIERDSLERFQEFMKEVNEYKSGYNSWSNFYGDPKNYTGKSEYETGKLDDFFLDDKYSEQASAEWKYEPLIPSTNVLCDNIWVTMRSEMNYKYLWMHATESQWLGASATMDTPIHRKTFRLHPIQPDCSQGGWVLLQEGDSNNFIWMISPNRTEAYANDAWVVKLGTTDINQAYQDSAYHFLLEKDGYLVNRESLACVNVMTDAESQYIAKGHSNGWNHNLPAGREFGAMLHFTIVNNSEIETSLQKEAVEERLTKQEDESYIQQISRFPLSNHEKKVISFGLYGSKPKYTIGAIRNVQLAQVYFPGWICRFYVTSDVPTEIITNLTIAGAEIYPIPSGMGYISGMFWRFMVAADSTVDRYLIRDTDSRLNARDR